MTTSVAPREDSDSALSTTAPSRGEIRIDRTAKRIRTVLAGEIVADSVRANLAYATGRHPEYLLPEQDVDWGTFDVDDATSESDLIGSHHLLRSRNREGTVGRRYVEWPATRCERGLGLESAVTVAQKQTDIVFVKVGNQ